MKITSLFFALFLVCVACTPEMPARQPSATKKPETGYIEPDGGDTHGGHTGSGAKSIVLCRNTFFVAVSEDATTCALSKDTSIQLESTETLSDLSLLVRAAQNIPGCTLKYGLLAKSDYRDEGGQCL